MSPTCQSCKKEFVIDSDDFAFYEKISVPPPTWCPWCRMVRRMAFWNERSFFRRAGESVRGATAGKTILSTFPPESPYTVVHEDVWWSDEFDPLAYGREYDFSRPFFEQLRELAFTVPVPHRAGLELIDSEYCNQANHLRNCYMCFNVHNCENSLYCVAGSGLKDSIDLTNMSDSELCYDIDTGNKCHKVFFGAEVDESLNSRLLYDCEGVSDCYGCVGLRRKKYHIFNQEYSKEDYFRELEKMNVGSYTALEGHKKRWRELMLATPRRYYSGVHNVNVIGENICHSKNAKYCYKACTVENVAYSQTVVDGVRDSYDFTNWGVNAERMYEAVNCGIQAYDIKFSFDCAPNARDLQYCISTFSSTDCFASVSLKKNQYCILNKQYSKDEYEKLVPKIIQHMNEMPYTDELGRVYTYGEFFPFMFAPYAANETALIDFTRMKKEEAEAFGLSWRESKPTEYVATINSKDLPDHINEVNDTIVKEIIACLECGKAYRVTDRELVFLKEQVIPLPRKCHNCRFKDRLEFHNIPKWYDGQCKKTGCSNTFVTTYSPERQEVVYCEACYQQEIV